MKTAPHQPGDRLHVLDQGDARLIADVCHDQPPLKGRGAATHVYAIASLALGGAERIVLDAAQQSSRLGFRTVILVWHEAKARWQVPEGVEVMTRDRAEMLPDFLARIERHVPQGNVVQAHLLDDATMAGLCTRGFRVVTVVHNDRQGWRSSPSSWSYLGISAAVAPASAIEQQIRDAGCRVPTTVIRHQPRPVLVDAGARRRIRDQLRIGPDELLIIMVGSFKRQKRYDRAMHVLAEVLQHRPARLVILGGWNTPALARHMHETVAAGAALRLCRKVMMPGFVSNTPEWHAAADVFLNTSDFEGLSIATQ